MKQIKTITNRLDNHESFDKEVNAAIAEGWTLVNRYVINPHAHPVGHTFHTMLYAELECEMERNCETCKHCDKTFKDEPCDTCTVTGSNWEEKES